MACLAVSPSSGRHCLRTARSSSSATTPSMAIRASGSMARPATATRSAHPTPTPPGVTATAGPSWRSWSTSPSLDGLGRCRCWSPCTTAQRTTPNAAERIARRPNCYAAWRQLLLHWFPDRQFVLVGDAGFGTHEVSRFCQARRGRLTLVSKLHPDANLVAQPPPYRSQGRPRVKGAGRLPKPRVVAATAWLRRTVVRWYGGGAAGGGTARRRGPLVQVGPGLGAVALGVRTRPRDGTHRDEFFFTTDLSFSPEAIVGHYAWRHWNVETTFQEARGSSRARKHPRRCGAVPPYCGPPRLSSGCTPWSPSCSLRCPTPSNEPAA